MRSRLLKLSIFTAVLGAWSAPAAAWQTTFDSPGVAGSGTAAALDAAGDVIVSGYIGGDGIVAKLSGTTGSEIWRRQVAGDLPSVGALVVDPATGDVVTAGTAGGDLLVLKLSGANGSVVWRRTIAGTADEDDIAQAVALDANGDIVAVGAVENAGSGEDLIAIKLSGATGGDIWRREFDGTANGEDEAYAVAVDTAGDVVVGGYTENIGTDEDFAVLKLAAGDGAELWRREIEGLGGDDYVRALAIDAAGDVVAGGQLQTILDGFTGLVPGFAVAKLSGATGAIVWLDDPTEYGYAGTLAIDPSGDVVAAGSLYTLDAVEFGVKRLASADGTELWRYVREGCAVWAAGIDSAGDVVAAGCLGPRSTYDLAMVRLAPASGTEIWRRELAGTGDLLDYAIGLAVDPAGDHVVAGQVREPTADFPDFGRSIFTVVRARDEVSGNKFSLRDRAADPTARKLRLDVRDSELTAPTPAGAADPTIGGASFEIFNATSGEHATIALDAGAWSGIGSPAGARGYRYKSKTGPCAKVSLERGRLRVQCKGAGVDFSLDEPAQGALAVRLTTGSSALHYCAVFGGTVQVDSAAAPDHGGEFRAKDAPAPASCPLP
jgi:hypothetical protein